MGRNPDQIGAFAAGAWGLENHSERTGAFECAHKRHSLTPGAQHNIGRGFGQQRAENAWIGRPVRRQMPPGYARRNRLDLGVQAKRFGNAAGYGKMPGKYRPILSMRYVPQGSILPAEPPYRLAAPRFAQYY